MSSNTDDRKLRYNEFQKVILDFQLQEHERFLFKFTEIYQEIDTDKDGCITEDEFRMLIKEMNVIDNEDEIQFLLHQIDPYNNQKMTFSEVVQLLSSHMVPQSEEHPDRTIPLLEKFVNIHE